MIVREPIVAGRFYEAQPERCRSELRQLFGAAQTAAMPSMPSNLGGLVPHAGWMCSGVVAARVFHAISLSHSPATVVLFGGVHSHRGRDAAMFTSGCWRTPLGSVDVDARLAERIMGHTNLVTADHFAHENEHSIEVQVPFVQHLFPEAKILPIMVPPVAVADEVGEAVARTISTYNYDAVVIGTTDLTHYGPAYGFTPEGVGSAGNEWAKVVNDTRFLDLVCRMQAKQVVAEATQYRNACSSGAVAATIAAAKALGATRGELLEHTSSSEVLGEKLGAPQKDSVGYAGVVFV